MTDRQRHGFILLLVAALIAASVLVIASQRTILGLDLKGGVQLVYQGQPTAQSKVTPAALSRAVDIMRSRVDQLGVSQPEIQTDGGSQISVGLPDVSDINRAENEVGATATLYFYDWEANALTPNGKTVASQLITQDPTALAMSRGVSATVGPGEPGAGSQSLYQAVKLASGQPQAPYSKALSRTGTQYWMFGAPGSAACTAAARHFGVTPIAGDHCLLAGPDNESPGTPQAQAVKNLDAQLPAGVTASEGQVLGVPQGTVVIQAANPSAAHQIKYYDPTAQFFVLKDNVALTGKDITNPTEGTDSTGAPDVQFGFTGSGASRFQSITGQIAHRGANVSLGGTSLNQHFAVALGGITSQLITVPQIDFKQYPDGIVESGGSAGASITGGFSSQSASDLANELRLGALPINLKLISESRVSATLGSQALHQGLIAGAIGLLVVCLFLVAYYRVLGLIAVAGLAAYALYFFALIKLIPITLTLPGMAGLILTIGVAADANIVIFERVKEEIRAGRSIRAGIATGYKKGLTAIIDANVVTIMTAFILFVLATAEVQGFAFTLGIGVIVSLFTAVMATQAILMTMSDTKVIARPSALGAGGKKHEWRFDFMGKSKYFFTLSGVILLIGALAIGGRGLNLGIDFTSGTRVTTTLERPATSAEIQSLVSAAGASNPQIQRIGTKGETFQISSKLLQPSGISKIDSALNNRFGVRTFDDTSVGPTFGRTVANSAIIAIIASLLVISAYVALRFDWKFAVPVLIALMHDLLITAGVYALTGREVTVDTVAALLTILGYSLYDTIIVFDRVRENVPRMPRAAFSQIVNRSMSEVLTRSLATTSCTLLPIIALLLFGGSTLQDFAFALLIGVASGAYSSIFIASPVLTHWKERESVYRHRRHRIETEYGTVAPYATVAADVEPERARARRRARLTTPEGETVSAAEFEQMKRDIAEEEAEPRRRTSTLTQRLAHSQDNGEESAPARPASQSKPQRARRSQAKPAPSSSQPASSPQPASPPQPVSPPRPGSPPTAEPTKAPEPQDAGDTAPDDDFQHAPDEAENDAMPQTPKQRPANKSRSRNRRHGRRR